MIYFLYYNHSYMLCQRFRSSRYSQTVEFRIYFRIFVRVPSLLRSKLKRHHIYLFIFTYGHWACIDRIKTCTIFMFKWLLRFLLILSRSYWAAFWCESNIFLRGVRKSTSTQLNFPEGLNCNANVCHIFYFGKTSKNWYFKVGFIQSFTVLV